MAVKGPAPSEAKKVDSQETLTRERTLSKDILDTLVDALAGALVADYQQDTDSMVNSPGGKVHDPKIGST